MKKIIAVAAVVTTIITTNVHALTLKHKDVTISNYQIMDIIDNDVIVLKLQQCSVRMASSIIINFLRDGYSSVWVELNGNVYEPMQDQIERGEEGIIEWLVDLSAETRVVNWDKAM